MIKLANSVNASTCYLAERSSIQKDREEIRICRNDRMWRYIGGEGGASLRQLILFHIQNSSFPEPHEENSCHIFQNYPVCFVAFVMCIQDKAKSHLVHL